jgi:hypothetical protein
VKNHSGHLGCFGCHYTTYCSAECWETDILPHGLICQGFTRYVTRYAPPKDDSKIGLYFPVKGGNPVFFRLELDYLLLDFPKGHPVAHRTLLHPKDHPVAHRTLLQCNEYRAYDLDHTLALHPAATCTASIHTASIQKIGIANLCVSKFTKDTPFADFWRGDIFVLSMATPRQALDEPQYRDITLQDFRFIIDYFRYGDDCPRPLQVQSPHNKLAISNRVLGVRIKCEVEQLRSGNPNKYVSVRIPRDHYIFNDKPTEISRTIGLPLLMNQSSPQFINKSKLEVAELEIESEGSLFFNHEAQSLRRITDLDDNTWGLVPKYFGRPERIGSVLVARADGRDINPKQVAMIVTFCLGLESHILKARRKDKEDKEKVMTDLMTMEKFHLVFNMRKKKESKKDPSWKSLKSPYDD